jgi:deazaflavin-dependent oxidoreductase (nitroreductase family)
VARTYRLGPARRLVNTIVTMMLKLGVGAASTYLLTTTGRKTGQPRTTPVVLVESDDERWLVSPYGDVGWVHNVRATPQITLRRGRTTATLHAREVDAATAGPVLRRYLRQARVTAPFFDTEPDDAPERFVAEAHRHPVFRLVRDTTSG